MPGCLLILRLHRRVDHRGEPPRTVFGADGVGVFFSFPFWGGGVVTSVFLGVGIVGGKESSNRNKVEVNESTAN